MTTIDFQKDHDDLQAKRKTLEQAITSDAYELTELEAGRGEAAEGSVSSWMSAKRTLADRLTANRAELATTMEQLKEAGRALESQAKAAAIGRLANCVWQSEKLGETERQALRLVLLDETNARGGSTNPEALPVCRMLETLAKAVNFDAPIDPKRIPIAKAIWRALILFLETDNTLSFKEAEMLLERRRAERAAAE